MSNFSEIVGDLSKLAQSSNLHSGKFKEFLSEALAFVGVTMDGNAKFWLRRVSNGVLEGIQHFDLDSNTVSGTDVITLVDFQDFNTYLSSTYFAELELGLNNNQSQPEMAYLIQNHLKSWVSIQVWSEKKLFGVVSLEWKSKRTFTEQDKALLFGIASMIGQCHDSLLRLKAQVILGYDADKEESEPLQDSKAEKLQKKLSDHAFFTSHNIRHPLSTMLALIDLININWDSRESYEEHLQQLKIEAMNLDEIIRVMTAKIELD